MNLRPPDSEIIPTVSADVTNGDHAPSGNLKGCRLPVDPGLQDQGWEWRCNADHTKLDQMVDTYQELGFEVRVERLVLDGLSEDCIGCKDSLAQSLSVLVRRKG